ncbi:MAG: hypothetical protein V3V05_11450 [Pontiella sp.]
MKNENNNLEVMVENQAEILLKQLLHLKQYEKPETARMTRNKQNIMRQVREANANKRKSIGDLIELNIPWFFSEPKYGIAACFIAFVALQYVGISSQNSSQSTGIYMPNNNIAALQQRTTIAATNSITYPSLPNNYQLFDSKQGSSDVMLVERLVPKK